MRMAQAQTDTETVLHNFAGPTNGANPYAGVIRDPSGILYGSTEDGGKSGAGVVFKVNTAGQETVLYSFCSLPSCLDGALPEGGVLRDSAGNLYGTTYSGGKESTGVVFKLAP
jgi:uncharacterized repeat protein (TIGR03803 family)